MKLDAHAVVRRSSDTALAARRDVLLLNEPSACSRLVWGRANVSSFDVMFAPEESVHRAIRKPPLRSTTRNGVITRRCAVCVRRGRASARRPGRCRSSCTVADIGARS